MTEPCGARLPRGKADRTGQAALAGTCRGHDHVIRIDAVAWHQPLAQPSAGGRCLPPGEHSPSVLPVDGQHFEVEQAQPAQLQHDFRHAAGQEDAHGRMADRAVGQRIDESRHLRRLTCVPIVDRGPSQAGSVGDGRHVQQQFVEPPKAAWTTIALRNAASVRRSPSVMPRSCQSTELGALRRAMSSQIGWPEGASAECGRVRPSASPTTCEVAAVPRNWQPPPGEAHARQPSSAASSRVISPMGEASPDRLDLAGVFALGGRQRDAARHQHARQIVHPASAIIIAGSPLSHVATPRTPRRVGSERINRRKTIAASLRYGRLSIMPVVPCVRPSHGIGAIAGKRHAPRPRISFAAAFISRPTSQCPV